MVFSLSSKEEARRKPLFGSKNRANGDFFDLLINQTSQLVSNVGVDVVWMDESKQTGTDFASRFTNAFKQLYAQGYNNVISIGNDSPDLNLGHVTSAIKKLEQGNMILGPSSDGGAYLIGMHRSQFNAATFKALPWQQETLFSEMAAEAYSKNLSVFYLNILDDIDATEDLFGYVKKNPYTLLAVFAKEFLSEGSSSFGQFLIGPALQKCYSSSALRAPPFQLAA